VAAGDALFEIDPVPFRLALQAAQSKLDAVRTQFASLKSNYKSFDQLVSYGEQGVALKKRDVDRKTALAESRAGSQMDLDNSKATLLLAELQLELGRQQLASTRNQLLNNPDLAIEDYPPYRESKAALDQAQRNLDHALVTAPIAGIATQVDNIQLGRYVTAGMPVFSVIDDVAPWVDANPKETDITWLRPQQQVDIYVDSFPDRTFHGTVQSVSPGTGAQFAILPPQNANGNWVKVVQRVPVRIAFDPDQDLAHLRAGMSVTVDIDTKRHRTLASLIGAGTSLAQGAPKDAAAKAATQMDARR
jgi:membrane fusion protein, multidrug efflux system